MDNTNNLTSSILEPNNSFASSESSGGVLGYIQSISVTTWLIIILILAFLGFNIFAYLAKGTQDVTGILGPLLQNVFGYTASVTGQVVDVSAEGTKGVVNASANVVNSGLSEVQNVAQGNTSLKPPSLQQESNPLSNNPLNNKLNNANSNSNSNSNSNNGNSGDYEASEAHSSVHSSGGKSGWCYVGKDNGIRSCAKVGEDDTCMSGDIFPTQEICVNPNLRP